MARALTAGELTNLRKDGQVCTLYLAVHSPSSVFTARLNGAPSSDDRVAEITYDGGSAGYANAIAGQTVYVGSSAGAYDKGMVRLRSTISAVSGTMDIGETSEIDWADNDYLTVVDEFGLWPKHIQINSSGVSLMDYDVAYSDQHADCDPVPVLGPPAVAWLNSDDEADIEFDASDSWVVGSSISTYAWTALNGSWDDDTSATPTLTVTAAGTYRVSCTVTAANGKSYTGYRYVFVFDTGNNQPTTSFALDDCSGDWERGGWSYSVTMYDEAQLSEIRNRAMVVLFAKDFYGTTETSIGPVSGRENVVAVGWVDGESIEWSPEQSSVTFDVQGAYWWLGRMMGFPSGVEDYDGTPTAWTEFEDLTVDKGLWHLLHWRTTASLCMDYILTGDTREIAVFDAPVSTLWEQLVSQSYQTILATPACDRYGRLFIEINQQFIDDADRSSIPVVHTLTTGDWREKVSIQRRTVTEVSQIDLSGVAYSAGSGAALFSLAPGHVFKRFGALERFERLALSTQNAANSLASQILANRNGPYPLIQVALAANHRGFDICPRQYGNITVAAADTERGISLSSYNIIPRRMRFQWMQERGMLLTDVDFEGETSPTITGDGGGIDGDPPPTPPDSDPDDYPDPWGPPEDPGTTQYDLVIAFTYNQIGRSLDFFSSTSPTWEDISTGLTATGWISNVAVNALGEAYLVKYDTYVETNGVYYCPDILADSISWSLILSIQDMRDECDYAGAFPYSVECNSSGYAYVVSRCDGSWHYGYWEIASGVPAFNDPAYNTPEPVMIQFMMRNNDPASNDDVAFGGGGNYTGGGHVIYLPSETYAKCTSIRSMWSTSPNYCTSGANGVFKHTVDIDAQLYSDADYNRPLVESGASLFWTALSDKDLIKDDVQFAAPADVFGVGKVGAGFDVPSDDATRVLWVCYNASPSIRAIAYWDGAQWNTKDGNWTAAIGAWSGYNSVFIPDIRYFKLEL